MRGHYFGEEVRGLTRKAESGETASGSDQAGAVRRVRLLSLVVLGVGELVTRSAVRMKRRRKSSGL